MEKLSDLTPEERLEFRQYCDNAPNTGLMREISLADLLQAWRANIPINLLATTYTKEQLQDMLGK